METLAYLDVPEALGQSAPCDLFGSADDRTWLWLLTEGRKACPWLRAYLPGVPDEKSQSRCSASIGDAALELGLKTYVLFRDLYRGHRGKLSRATTVLDFGCGWGRLIRFFLHDIAPTNLYGIDRDSSAIMACRETNQWCHFDETNVFPPTSFTTASFDLIYCYSVFSHLPEQLHDAWLGEFQRILKPGGILLATTLPRSFIVVCRELRARAESELQAVWQQEAAHCFEDTAEELARYDRGAFSFDFVRDPLYGYACIPRGYVEAKWGDRFRVLGYIDEPPSGLQTVIAVQRT
jgi:2-polyprenyl-3-methyl-5-hydroxy-6-metoxy-1,4-benzoquinol methylase